MVKIERTTYPSWHVVSLSCSMMVIQDHNSKHHRGSHHHHDAIKVGACKKGLMKITDKLLQRKWRKSRLEVCLLICDKYFITFKISAYSPFHHSSAKYEKNVFKNFLKLTFCK